MNRGFRVLRTQAACSQQSAREVRKEKGGQRQGSGRTYDIGHLDLEHVVHLLLFIGDIINADVCLSIVADYISSEDRERDVRRIYKLLHCCKRGQRQVCGAITRIVAPPGCWIAHMTTLALARGAATGPV